MSGPLTQARQYVADALATAGVRVYASPVEAPAPPCLQVSGSPSDWVSRPRLKGGKVDVSITVRATVPVVSGNAEALGNIEDLVWTVMRLVPVTGAISAPRLENINQIDVYVVDLPTTVTASE